MPGSRGRLSAVRLLLLVLVAVLLLAGCGEATEEPSGGATGTAPAEPGATPTQTAAPTPTAQETPTPADEDGTDGGTEGPTEDADADVQPLAGEPSTEERRVDAQPGDIAIVGVRVAAHDGFDRVVIDIEGDGVAGWWTSYVDEARTAGKGDVIPLEGEAVLAIGVQGATLPPDLPEGIEPWMGEQRSTPEGQVVAGVASDVVFEGVHEIFIGLDRERPYVIGRLEDPQRIVVDIFHD